MTFTSPNGFTLQIGVGDQHLVDALALNYATLVKQLPRAVENTGGGFPAPPDGYDAVRVLRTGEAFYETIAEDMPYFEQLEQLITVVE